MGVAVGIAAVAHEPGDGVGLARLAVAQKDDLDLVEGAGSAQSAVFEPFGYHLVGLLEDGHVGDGVDSGFI